VTDRGKRSAQRTLSLTAAMAFFSTLDLTIVVVAFGDIQDSFGAVSTATLSWILTAFTIVAAGCLVPSGRLSDRFGARRTFLAGVSCFTLGSLLSGLAPNAYLLIAARVVQAVGSALQTPAALALISIAYPIGRSTAVGIWGAVSGLGSALGPSLGAVVVEGLGWRWIFLLNVPLGLAILAVSRRFLPSAPPTDPHASSDYVGSAVLMGGVAALALALVQSETWGAGDVRTIGCGVLGLLLLVGVVARSARHPRPVLDLALYRIPSFRWSNVVAIVFPIAFFAQFFGFVVFLRQVWGYSTLRAGLLITPVSAVTAAVTAVAGPIADRYGHRAAMVPGALLYAVGCGWLLVGAGPHRDLLGVWFPAGAIIGVGVGLTYTCFNSAALADLPPERFGAGGGVMQTVNRTGGTLGVALAVALIGESATAARFDRLWWVMLVGGLATAVVSWKIDTRPARPARPDGPAAAPAAVTGSAAPRPARP
jgi:EmrB/QacA subfamily drug resistance transporter